jgi:membrane-bound lytic murein transglycosylase F
MESSRLVHCYLLLLILLPSAGFALPVEHDKNKWTDRFDHHFKKYSKRYFGPHFEWRWFKSQGIAESNLNPKATSPVGARGIMQILPTTYDDIQKANPSFLALDDPRWNIAAGIFYDRQLYRKWRKPLPSAERLFLAFSSYNAGYGRVLKAVKRSKREDYSWNDVKQHLPAETKGYVARIASLMDTVDRHRDSPLREALQRLFD